jgi:16S rRNA (guanine1207-N2)-methyltransferase
MPAVQLLYQSAIDSLNNDSSRVAVINAHADPRLKEINSRCNKLVLLQHFKPEYDELVRMGLNCSQSLEKTSDLILLIPFKNKQQTLNRMAEAMQALAENGKLIVVCPNKHGAKSYEAALEKLAGNVTSSSKSKCRIFSARKSSSLDGMLAKQWIADARPGVVNSHGLIAQPGLFSWEKVDSGSQLLLQNLPDSLSGTGMDLCCGYGLLSENILRRYPEIKRLYLIEADRLALECAGKNTRAWQEKIQSHWLDAAAGPLPLKLDWVVCNPPFHAGQQQDISLGQTIIANACGSLKRGGRLYMVANRKLPYEATLEQRLMQYRIVTQEQGFKVIEATKGRIK